MTPLVLFLQVLKASLLSTGGLGNAPSLHADLVRTGILDERAFSSALAVGQLSPGPNGMWTVALGYSVAGILGALAGFVAILLPPFAVLGVEALVRRAGEHPGVEGFVWGLGITVAGTSGATMLLIVRGEGAPFETVALALGALAVGLWGRLPAVVVLLIAAAIGLIWRS